MNTYSRVPVEFLRELLLNNDLKHENLNESDYKRLLDFEYHSVKVHDKVLDFCKVGLKQYPYYAENPFIRLNIRKKRRSRLLILSAAIISAFFAAQLILQSFGLSIWKYLFNWVDPERVKIEQYIEIQSANDMPDYDNDYMEFMAFSEIPAELQNFCPEYLLDNFLFFESYYRSVESRKTLIFSFLNYDNKIEFIIRNTELSYIEKDSDPIETEYIDDFEIFYFSNTGDSQAIWQYGELLYQLDTEMGLGDLRKLVSEMLQSKNLNTIDK